MTKATRLLRNIYHLFYRSISYVFVKFTNISNNRILMSSYAFTRYSCNPKYITDYLLKNKSGKYDIIWCFRKDIHLPPLPDEVKVVRWRTLKYFYYLATSKFIISNVRLGHASSHLVKRKGQKYIMTWHSSMGIKKVEKDGNLDREYIELAKSDSKDCDLIFSGCKFRSNIIRSSFWYSGAISEFGTPRNDMLFQDNSQLKKAIYNRYSIPKGNKILLYAPTFRDNYKLDNYKLEWEDAKYILQQKFKDNYTILLRLHPTFLSNKHNVDTTKMGSGFIDVTDYEDMQELLSISDILITDYSSSIFDFALLKKPIFIYASDYLEYNRGTYLALNELPFPFASDNTSLLKSIQEFDIDKYQNALHIFNDSVIGSFETGHAAEMFCKWMEEQ